MILAGILATHVVAWAFTWALIEEKHILKGEFNESPGDANFKILVSFFWPMVAGWYAAQGVFKLVKPPARLMGRTAALVIRAISSTALAIVRLPKKIAGMKEQKKLPAARVVSR